MNIKKRHFFIAIGICLIALIVGSFCDLQIAQSIFSDRNMFCITISSIAFWPTYAGVCFCGGGLITIAIKGQYKLWQRMLIILLGIISTFAGSYFMIDQFVGINGFNLSGASKLLVLIPEFVFSGGGFVLGIVFFWKRLDSSSLIKAMLLAVAFGLSIGMVTLIKSIMNRPRYRSLVTDEFKNAGIYFSAWWNKFNITDKIKSYSFFSKEEFKSFPSGHTSCSVAFILYGAFLPSFIKTEKAKKTAVILFYIGLAYGAFVAFNRMILGAHFLSDVSIGALCAVLICFAFTAILKQIDNKTVNKAA